MYEAWPNPSFERRSPKAASRPLRRRSCQTLGAKTTTLASVAFQRVMRRTRLHVNGR
jgi:hypothetical protein